MSQAEIPLFRDHPAHTGSVAGASHAASMTQASIGRPQIG